MLVVLLIALSVVLVLLARVPFVGVVELLLKALLELLAAVVVGRIAADDVDAVLAIVAVAQNLHVEHASSAMLWMKRCIRTLTMS